MLQTRQPSIDLFDQSAGENEKCLLQMIRSGFTSGTLLTGIPVIPSVEYNPEISQTYITLFQSGQKPLRWGSRRSTLQESINRNIEKISQHASFPNFTINNAESCRIMLEIVISERPINFDNLSANKLVKDRLEPGIDGLKIIFRSKLYYYMPTDAITHNIMSIRQALNYICKRIGIGRDTNSIRRRISLLARLPVQFTAIRSMAFISHGEECLPLYRGYPQPVDSTRANLRQTLFNSVDWIVKGMKSNGQFLYYYDPILDSEVDFQHPRMTNPTYYNILRHCGGTITLLRAYELRQDEKLISAAKHSIEFFISTIREHQHEGRYACYPFFNKKSKLGGAGIGLVALMMYYKISGDNSYDKYIEGLVIHILSRICDDGEMIGYFIHPGFMDGSEIHDPSDNQKELLFSFYYPGEALLGLVLYLENYNKIPDNLYEEIYQSCIRALDFLVTERPKKYHFMFRSLPSDGWLMQAIEAWYRLDGKDKTSYREFVFNDADAMISHMYDESNAPYPDYVGAFFYEYGDHAYPDGARCEGLIAAYYLAKQLAETSRLINYKSAMEKSARCLMQTYNSDSSTYAHNYPEKSIGSFRFKLTRQWVRVDSVQHTACYFSRLLQAGKDI